MVMKLVSHKGERHVVDRGSTVVISGVGLDCAIN